ncbi:MAG: hypothetical protein HQL53_08090, partial [Magnetococcales bacterium]|nr:hypothetical protein [Magnetococcales bacterium]
LDLTRLDATWDVNAPQSAHLEFSSGEIRFPGGTVQRLEGGATMAQGPKGVSTYTWKLAHPSTYLDLNKGWALANRIPGLRQLLGVAAERVEQLSGQVRVEEGAWQGTIPQPADQVLPMLGAMRVQLNKASLITRAAQGPGGKKPPAEQIALSDLSTRIEALEKGLLAAPVAFVLSRQDGGRLSLRRGSFDWPLHPERLRFELKADAFEAAGWRLDGGLDWRGETVNPLDFTVQGPKGFAVRAAGNAAPWAIQGKSGAAIHLDQLIVTRPPPEQSAVRAGAARPAAKALAEAKSGKLLFPDGAPHIPFPLRLHISQAKVDGVPPFEDLTAQAIPIELDQGRPGLEVGLAGLVCQVGLSGGVRVDDAGLATGQMDLDMRDVNLSNLVACLLAMSHRKSAPILMDGRSRGRLHLDTHGRSLHELEQALQADLSMTVREGRVMRLSKLHGGFGLLLKVMKVVGLNSTRLRDTLTFEQLLIRARGNTRRVRLRALRLISEVMQVNGTATIDLTRDPPVMVPDFSISSPLTLLNRKLTDPIPLADEVTPVREGSR